MKNQHVGPGTGCIGFTCDLQLQRPIFLNGPGTPDSSPFFGSRRSQESVTVEISDFSAAASKPHAQPVEDSIFACVSCTW